MHRPPPPPPPSKVALEEFSRLAGEMIEAEPGVYVTTNLTQEEYDLLCRGDIRDVTFVPISEGQKTIERPTEPTWGLTKHGRIVPIGDGRLEAEEKADPVMKVSGDGWTGWQNPVKGEVVVTKPAVVKSKKLAATAVASVEFA